jgi:hypothetical protein
MLEISIYNKLDCDEVLKFILAPWVTVRVISPLLSKDIDGTETLGVITIFFAMKNVFLL